MGYSGSSLEDYWPHELIEEAARQIKSEKERRQFPLNEEKKILEALCKLDIVMLLQKKVIRLETIEIDDEVYGRIKLVKIEENDYWLFMRHLDTKEWVAIRKATQEDIQHFENQKYEEKRTQ
jgi:hypothetical protein